MAMELPPIPITNFLDSFSSPSASAAGLDLPLIPTAGSGSGSRSTSTSNPRSARDVPTPTRRSRQPAEDDLPGRAAHQRYGTEPVESVYRARVRESSEPEPRSSRSYISKPATTSFDTNAFQSRNAGSSSGLEVTDRAERADGSPDRLPSTRGMAQHRSSPRPPTNPQSQARPHVRADHPDLRMSSGSGVVSVQSQSTMLGGRRAPPERLDLASPSKNRYTDLGREEGASAERRRVVTEPVQVSFGVTPLEKDSYADGHAYSDLATDGRIPETVFPSNPRIILGLVQSYLCISLDIRVDHGGHGIVEHVVRKRTFPTAALPVFTTLGVRVWEPRFRTKEWGWNRGRG